VAARITPKGAIHLAIASATGTRDQPSTADSDFATKTNVRSYITWSTSGWKIATRSARTHRTLTQRTLVQAELSKHLMQSQDARKRFPRAVDALKSDDGQEALRELMYKVCSNYRRRLRHKKRDPSNAAVEVLTQRGALPKSGPRLGSNLL
jgi:hypothetical protein